MSSDALIWKPLEKVLPSQLLGPLSLEKGDLVRISGLQSRPDLNGTDAHITLFDSNRARYGVRFADGNILLLKPASIDPLYLRVDGRYAPVGAADASFVATPLSFHAALRYEDGTQLQSNTYSVQHHKRCDTVAEHCSRDIKVAVSGVEGAGDGVFCERAFAKGEVVTQFAGVWRDVSSIGSESYSQRTEGGMVEGDREQRDVAGGVAHIINDGACIDAGCCALTYLQRSNATRNVAMTVMDGVVVAVALRDLDKGEELLHSYGVAYWLGRVQRAALLSHDLVLSKKCDEQFKEFAEKETLMLASGTEKVSWLKTPSLCIVGAELQDSVTKEVAPEQVCRQLCWARLGVESFVLAPPNRDPMECHVLAACALLCNVAPRDVPKWCVENG